MFIYDANVKHIASVDDIQSKLFQTTGGPKLTCDVASVFSLLFTLSSFVPEHPLSAI